MKNSVELAKEVQDFVVDFRRDVHEHPEASFEEFRTTDRLEEELHKMGIPTKRLEPTGLFAEIVGGKPGKMIALRADIDALSITEESGVPFASKNPGFMHACGHDTHMAMLLGAAKCLNENKDELAGSIRLIFQPAEEVGKGAKAAIDQGALENVDMIFGMHIFAQVPPGIVAISSGPILAASHTFKIKVKGSASHGAMPDKGIDATLAASAIVMNLQSIVSREIPPLDTVVVTVGKLVSGTRFNIVSGEADMEGTVRFFNREIGKELPGIIERIARDTAAAYRCKVEIEYEDLIDVVVNDEEASAIMLEAAEKVVAVPQMIQPMGQQMGSEDFAEYSRYAKAAFAALGGGGEYPQHSERFCIDESAMMTGVALYIQTAVDALAK